MTRYRNDFANLMLHEQRLARRANQEEETLSKPCSASASPSSTSN